MKKAKPKKEIITDERTCYPALISQDVRKIARDLLGPDGSATIGIIENWQAVVGDKISECSLPLKIKFPRGKTQGGMLHILVTGGGFVQYIAYQKLTILEKVNQYFGYDAVSDLKIISSLYINKKYSDNIRQQAREGYISDKNEKNVSVDETPASGTLQQIFDTVDDDKLKQHLRKLAKMCIS